MLMDFSGQMYNQEGTVLKHIFHRYHDICIFSVFLTPLIVLSFLPTQPTWLTYDMSQGG